MDIIYNIIDTADDIELQEALVPDRVIIGT